MTNFVRLGSVVSAFEQRVVLSSLRNARSTGSHTMAYCGVTVSVFELRKLLEKMRPRCLWNRRKLLALAEFRRCLRQLGLEFRPDILGETLVRGRVLECADAKETLSSRPRVGHEAIPYLSNSLQINQCLCLSCFLLKELLARACGRAQSQWR